MNDHRGVVDPVPVAQRRPDDEHRHQLRRRHDKVKHCILDRIQQCVVHDDVLDRVAGQLQFRVHRTGNVVVVAGPREPQHRFGVGHRIPPERRDACTRQPARSGGGRPSRSPSLSIVAFHVSTSGDGVERQPCGRDRGPRHRHAQCLPTRGRRTSDPQRRRYHRSVGPASASAVSWWAASPTRR